VVPTFLMEKALMSLHLGVRKAAYKKKDKESAKSK
jgi:hypothetical protein